jgi:anhydro-N-acetylmuramic acid kinase
MKVIGLMSGTSMDAVDVALIETDGEVVSAFGPGEAYPYSEPERQLLREAVASARGLSKRDDRSGVLAVAEAMITAKHAEAVGAFTAHFNIDPAEIAAVGFHGQTVIHDPEKAFTVQIGDGSALAKAIGMPVVYDLRARDMEQGGQGAPLVPIYHQALARKLELPLPAVFLNIGGLANVTFVPEADAETGQLIAFDTGPGNCLLDDWVLKHNGTPFDEDARIALSGNVSKIALEALLSHPFFKAAPPKSLDRSAFSLDPLDGLSVADGAATLTAFTVASIKAATLHLPKPPASFIVAGGGAKNPHMVAGLRRVLQPEPRLADAVGLSAEFMEAQAFAYLAARHLRELPATFPGTTGVSEPALAGVLAKP